MLFIYARADSHRRNTRQYRFPVDIIWLDEGKRVLLITEIVNPCLSEKCPEYGPPPERARYVIEDRKSTRLNSSHLVISYAVFCLKKKKNRHILHLLHTDHHTT